jgi:hypothetical protein
VALACYEAGRNAGGRAPNRTPALATFPAPSLTVSVGLDRLADQNSLEGIPRLNPRTGCLGLYASSERHSCSSA